MLAKQSKVKNKTLDKHKLAKVEFKIIFINNKYNQFSRYFVVIYGKMTH